MYGTSHVHDDQFIIPSLISVSAAIMQQSLSPLAHSSAEQPAPEEAVPRRGVEGAAEAEEVHQEQERLPQAGQVGKTDRSQEIQSNPIRLKSPSSSNDKPTNIALAERLLKSP